MNAPERAEHPVRVYYPMRRGVYVTARYLRVGVKAYPISDLSDAFTVEERRPESYQLWARYRGVPMLLWVCANKIEFGQVCRALRRAIEAHRDSTFY